MSIELEKVRKKLDIYENLEEKPELFFTELFSKDTSENHLLYWVNIKSKNFTEYLIECLKRIDVFTDTLLEIVGDELKISMPALKYGKYQEFQPDDAILRVDMHNRKYRLCKNSIENYSDVMNTKYELETCELDDFIKKYESFTFKNRIKNAYESLQSDKKFHIKVYDFILHFIVSKKKVANAIDEIKAIAKSKNEGYAKYYKERLELQEFYNKNAPKQIDMLRSKQEEISIYLESLGYKEDDV